MTNITVCSRFRPLSSKERTDNGDGVCIGSIDSETFVFQHEKEEEITFSFDKVFYEESLQADVYDFLGRPIVEDAFNATNGSIITYGQTGAGKTYSMEGPNIIECHESKKGLLPRVVDGLFDHLDEASDGSTHFTIMLSMVEIYMEKVRDLLDLMKDNILIKESKAQGIILSGVTEIPVSDREVALKHLSSGIVNRAVGETQMNMASSRSHCLYIFTVHQDSTKDSRVRSGKVVLVDLAGSEKAEKSGAEGKVLEEAKTINKSLSALGNVMNALTCGSSTRPSHIPYRDSKLTRILQDALGGNCKTGLLCCCSPSPSNASETLSTLRFGSRAKHIKSSPCSYRGEGRHAKKHGLVSATCDGPRDRILGKLRERLGAEDVMLLEELFILEGLFFDPNSIEDSKLAFEDTNAQTIQLLQQTVQDFALTVEELMRENKELKERIVSAEISHAMGSKILYVPWFFISWLASFFHVKVLKKRVHTSNKSC